MKPQTVTLKLVLAFMVLIAILLGFGLLGLNRLALINGNIQEVTDHRWPKVQLAREALRYSSRNSRITMQIFLLQDRKVIDPLLEQRAQNTEKISELLKQIEAGLQSDTEKALIASVWTNRTPYVESYKRALNLLLKEGQPEAGRQMMAEVVTPNLLAYHKSWEAFVAYQGERMDQAGEDAEAYYRSTRRQVSTLLALSIILACLVAIFVTRGTTREVASRLRAEGGLREAHAVLERRVEERTAQLEKAHQELLDLSRQAGMAEVATGVLHNVGNVLNSVNVSANLVSDQVRKAPVADLGRVVALLREQGANLGAFFTSDPRGPKVPEFLAQLADKFTRQQETQLREVAALEKNIEHIKDIVAMQQRYAKVSGLTEHLSPAELIEDALSMNAGSFQNHEVEVARELAAGLPCVCVDKHKVLQILVNLLRNAKHACEDSGRADKGITVRATSEHGSVRITVADNGVGIPLENLNRIFNHGFTTKKTGHGFGLHSAANAAKEMGGSLTVRSDGPGRGAAFTLELPVEAAQRKEAA